MENPSSMESEKVDPSFSSALSSFPFGLRILVVDDDPTCLLVLEKMLKQCSYEVTTCEHAKVALSLLRERKGGYDVVLTDVHMPDIDGFELLEIAGLEMDIPVVMMSAKCDVELAKKGLEHGACYYLKKPVSMDEIKNIWQHIIRKKKADEQEIRPIGSVEEDNTDKKGSEDTEYGSSINEVSSKKQGKRKKQVQEEEDGGDCDEEHNTQKKPRLIWHGGLHAKFLNAVNKLGIDRAVPKKILELMGVPGLTRENIASHLQKYRLLLRKLEEVRKSNSNSAAAHPGRSKLTCVPQHMMINHKEQTGLPQHMMVNHREQTGYPKFSETPYNLIGLQSGKENPTAFLEGVVKPTGFHHGVLVNPVGFQPGVVGNVQNLNASLPLTSINQMVLLNQSSNDKNPSAILGFGQLMPNGPAIAQPLLPGNSRLGQKPSHPSQHFVNFGFGMVPQTKMGLSSLGNTMQMLHQKVQAMPVLSESGPGSTSGMMNAQQSNSFTNMGNVEQTSRFKQASPLNYTSNYSGLHLTSSGGLYGLTQTGPLGQASTNITPSCNLFKDITKEKTPLEFESTKEPPLLPELSWPDFSLDPFNSYTSLNQFSTSFPELTQELNNILLDNCFKGEVDGLVDVCKSSRTGNSLDPQLFDDIDFDNLIFNEPKDWAGPVESDFNKSSVKKEGSDDSAKDAP